MFLMFFQLIQDRMKANEYTGSFLSGILEVQHTQLGIYKALLTWNIAYESLHHGRSRNP